MDAWVRVAVRNLVRAPGFAATSILTLALGIGLSTAVFTIANALLVRRLPIGDPDRLVALSGDKPDAGFSKVPVTLSQVRELERQSQTLNGIGFLPFRGAVSAPAQVDDRVFPVQLGLVSGGFFEVLQARALIGRALMPHDDVEGAAPVAVLTHRAWQQRFGADSAAIGRSVTMVSTGLVHTIVGVMPPGLEYPRGTEVWVPVIAYSAAGGFLDIVAEELDLVARLRPGATATQAGAELTTYFTGATANEWQREARGLATPLADVILGDTKPALVLVAVAAALLLALTTLNVASLLLVRALGRARDLVMRAALGASRLRLSAPLLTENLVLAVLGGLAGAAFAVGAVRLFVGLAPATFPRLDEVRISGATLLAAVLATTGAALVSGLGPILFASRVRARDALRGGSQHSMGRRTRIVTEGLVVAQIALATATLCAAGLVTRSLIKLHTIDLAFDRGGLLVASLAMRPGVLSEPEEKRIALDLVITEIRALGGVADVTPVFAVPFVGAGGGIDARVSTPESSAEDPATTPVVNLEIAAPNYFAMLRLPILRGRPFNAADREGSTPVAIVSSSLARRLWPDREAVGQRLRMGRLDAAVVGEVPDTRYRDVRTLRPTLYLPIGQFPVVPSILLVRTDGSPEPLIPSLRAAIVEGHPGVTLVDAPTLDGMLEGPRTQPRLNATVLGLFASAALFLAAVGLFSTIAVMVRHRTREIGVRLALGATPRRVQASVMVRGLWLGATGAALGIAAALAASRLLAALLFETGPTDLTTMLAVGGVMLLSSLAACLVPARVGMRVDPAIALRTES